MRPVWIQPFVLTFLLLLFPPTAGALRAQGPQEAAGQDSARVAARPVVIPVAAVPGEADALSTALQEALNRLGRSDAVRAILEALPAFADTLTSALEDPSYRPSEGASLRGLERVRRGWAPFQERLAEWGIGLTERSEELALARDTFLQAREIWERTRDTASAQSAPEPILARTTTLLQEIDTTRAQLRAHLDTLLSAVDQVSRGQGAIQEILSQVDSAEVSARGRLLSPDSPPLWRAIQSQEDSLTLGGEIRASWNGITRDWRSYRRTYGEDLFGPLVVFVIVLLLLQALGRQAQAWAKRSGWPGTTVELEGTRRVLSRPFSAALVLALLAWRVASTTPAANISAVVLVAMVVPVVRLIPGSILRGMGRPLYGLAALWVLGEGTTLALDGSLLQRLALLGAAGLGVGLYWAVRPGSPLRALATNRWGRAALMAGQLGILLMGVSLVANVFGLLSLAEILTRATIHSAVAAAVAATIVTVLDDLIWMVLRADWALRLHVVREYSHTMEDRLRLVARVGIGVLWLSIALGQFGIQRAVVRALGVVLGTPLNLGTFSLSLGDALAFALVLWLSVVLSRAIRALLEEDVLPSVDLPRGIPAAISTLVHYAALFIGFLLAAAAAGFDLSRFTLLAGAFGVGLGFGLQNIVNNFVSGLILIFERPIQVGDAVEVGGIQGEVKGIGIRASRVRTWTGAEVIVPNGDLISQQVTNWTLDGRLRRLEINVGAKYGTDPQMVIGLLTETVSRHPETLADPPPYAVFKGFGPSSLDFVVRAWTASESWLVVNSDLGVAVNNAFRDAGIEIPYPQQDLHLRSVDPEVRLGG